ncbi:uncharacterized protein LOC117323744 [Pecten maximus]|uniref:uncharacterized protein LOC117323744 n=1 Tax=Pecten maximus TaxID=6579 RepID=UPI00145882E7|nr:uncharacterized protein LOC117323744 [Pecten maximus]
MSIIRPVMRMLCVLAATTAYMIPDTMVNAVSIHQTTTPTDQLAMLTKQRNDLENMHSNDANEISRLNQKVEELQRFRIVDLERTSMLTRRIEELERKRDDDVQAANNITPAKDEALYHNISGATPDGTTRKDEARSAYVSQSSPESRDSSSRIQYGRYRRVTRTGVSNDVVAFHVILTHTISDPSTNHPVIYDHVITNTGGASYNAYTGVFTCTQPGVHVFSWSIFEAGHHYIFTDLVRNNAVIGSAQTGQDTGFSIASSATVTVHLEGGDVVWVRVNGHGAGSDILPNLSMFTGFRL